MIKICCVDEDGRYGGPQSRMIDVYKNINLKKYKYDFVIPNNVSKFKKKLKKNRIKFYQLELTRLSRELSLFLKYIFFLPFEIFILIKFFKEKRYSAIQVNGVPHFKTAIAARLSNIPVIWIVEDSYSPKIIKLIFRLLVKFCNPKIIYLSKKVYEFYLKDLSISRNNLFKIMSPTNSNYFKKKNIYNRKIINICSVSGIISVKDTETFLNVAKEVLRKNNNINFFFAGIGTKSEKKYYRKIMRIYLTMEKKFKKRIFFLGEKSNIKKLLNDSDIFLFTSKSEGGPIAVWEAMSMKLPVVTTNVGGTSEFIRNGYNGFVCSISDYKGLAHKLSILISNFKLRKKFGIRSRKIVEQFLDSKVIAKKYQKVYESIFKKL